MIKNVLGALLALGLVCGMSFADQIDNEAMNNVPRGVLVKIDQTAKTMDVYRINVLVPGMSESSSSADKADAINMVARPENKVASFSLANSELDKDSSTGACCWGGWNHWNYYNPWYNTGYFGYYSYSYSYSWSWNYYGNCNWGWFY